MPVGKCRWGRPVVLRLKKQFLKKQTVSVKYWLMGRNSCIENFSYLTLSD
jgi:hypothetical protein